MSMIFRVSSFAICFALVNVCLTLQFEEVRAFLIHIRPLSLENLIETLTLKAAACHSEVDKCNTRAQIWWELNLQRRVIRQIHFLYQSMPLKA